MHDETPQPNPPAPTPPTETPAPTQVKKESLDPTRYGDWEMNGRAIDF